MKKMYFLMLLLLILGTASVKSQVTIGSQSDPHDGAVLELKSNNSRGLLLPKVQLETANQWAPPMGGDKVTGMMVYNIGSALPEGVYVWTVDTDNPNGFWLKVSGSVAPVDTKLPGEPGHWVNPGNASGSGTESDPYKNVCPETVVTLTAGEGYTLSGSGVFSSSGTVDVSKDGKTTTVYVTILSCPINPDGSAPMTICGKEYKTYVYNTGENNAPQRWMVQNTYCGNPEITGSNGSFYKWANASSACPDPWHLPTSAEWDRLVNIVNTDQTPGINKSWWNSGSAGAFAGHYYLSTPVMTGSYGTWWSQKNNECYGASSISMGGPGGPPADPYYYYSVRCVKNQ